MKRQRASAAGYHALTFPYVLPREQRMLDRVVADMRRGNISHALVEEEKGVSVWRRGWRQVEEGKINKIMVTKSWAGGGRGRRQKLKR